MHVSLAYFASGERRDRADPVVVQNGGHVDDDIHIFALDLFYHMDGRKSRYKKKVLGWYREEDARDLRRHDLNE